MVRKFPVQLKLEVYQPRGNSPASEKNTLKRLVREQSGKAFAAAVDRTFCRAARTAHRTARVYGRSIYVWRDGKVRRHQTSTFPEGKPSWSLELFPRSLKVVRSRLTKTVEPGFSEPSGLCARHTHDHHRTSGMTDDPFRAADHQRVFQSCPAVRADDNQVRVPRLSSSSPSSTA
jgi:hypothetical protein